MQKDHGGRRTACPFEDVFAKRLRIESETLVNLWLDRIRRFVMLDKDEIFPGTDLVDHVPLLIDGIARFLENPTMEISAATPVIAKAIELGDLRYRQGFDASQILKEYEVLGDVLFDFLVRQADEIREDCSRGELLTCGQRLFRSISVIQQHTTTRFLALDDERVREREERLRGFNRMVTHELKNRIGAAWGAADIMKDETYSGDSGEPRRMAAMVTRNLEGIHEILEDLSDLSRTEEEEAGAGRNALLPEVAARVVDDLREFADSRGVRYEIGEDLPSVAVPAAAVQIALNNLLSNAAKYHDPSKTDRWVKIDGVVLREGEQERVSVRVTDNGLGVPEKTRDRLFQRFFRGHEDVSEEEGSGLGLSIVKDTVEHIGGRVWAEFPEKGSVFAIEVPCEERQKAGGREGERMRGRGGGARAWGRGRGGALPL